MLDDESIHYRITSRSMETPVAGRQHWCSLRLCFLIAVLSCQSCPANAIQMGQQLGQSGQQCRNTVPGAKEMAQKYFNSGSAETIFLWLLWTLCVKSHKIWVHIFMCQQRMFICHMQKVVLPCTCTWTSTLLSDSLLLIHLSSLVYMPRKIYIKPPSWKTGSTSSKMYRPQQQQQHSSKQWAVDLGVTMYSWKEASRWWPSG